MKARFVKRGTVYYFSVPAKIKEEGVKELDEFDVVIRKNGDILLKKKVK